MLRPLFTLTSVLSLLVWIATVVLWVRSYFRLNSFGWRDVPCSREAGGYIRAVMFPTWFRISRRFRPHQAEVCPECGYDLRASPHRWRECGTSVSQTATARIEGAPSGRADF